MDRELDDIFAMDAEEVSDRNSDSSAETEEVVEE